MCITGLQRTQTAAESIQQPILVQGVQSPDTMEQILRQRLQEQQMNRFQ